MHIGGVRDPAARRLHHRAHLRLPPSRADRRAGAPPSSPRPECRESPEKFCRLANFNRHVSIRLSQPAVSFTRSPTAIPARSRSHSSTRRRSPLGPVDLDRADQTLGPRRPAPRSVRARTSAPRTPPAPRQRKHPVPPPRRPRPPRPVAPVSQIEAAIPSTQHRRAAALVDAPRRRVHPLRQPAQFGGLKAPPARVSSPSVPRNCQHAVLGRGPLHQPGFDARAVLAPRRNVGFGDRRIRQRAHRLGVFFVHRQTGGPASVPPPKARIRLNTTPSKTQRPIMIGEAESARRQPRTNVSSSGKRPSCR